MTSDEQILDTVRKILASQEAALALQQDALQRADDFRARADAAQRAAQRAIRFATIGGGIGLVVVVGVILFVVYTVLTTTPSR